MRELIGTIPSIRSVASVTGDLENGLTGVGHIPTDFKILDIAIDGGIRLGDLTVVGGGPGVGKTTLTLQWARNMAANGHRVVYVCYDHDEHSLLLRLLKMEAGDLANGEAGSTSAARDAIKAIGRGQQSLEDTLAGNLLLRAAHGRLQGYGDRLWLMSASRDGTGLDEIANAAIQVGKGGVIFVDYLQKVPHHDNVSEEIRVDHVASTLKEIAMRSHVAVVAVVVGDQSGLAQRRVRAHHMRGAAGIAYESDLLLMMNEKFLAVSKRHSAFDPRRAEEFKRRVVVSVDKNRHGMANIDVEFEKDFTHFRYDPNGHHVEEQLIDGIMFDE